MKRSAWTITGVLVALALLSAWFFGLDGRHSVILVGAALAGGIANGLLEAVQLPRAVLPAFPETRRGLGDLQSLEFSLSSTEPGTRAVLELHAVATALAVHRPNARRSATLDAFLSQDSPTALSHREMGILLDELDRLALHPTGSSANTPRTDADPTAPVRRVSGSQHTAPHDNQETR